MDESTKRALKTTLLSLGLGLLGGALVAFVVFLLFRRMDDEMLMVASVFGAVLVGAIGTPLSIRANLSGWEEAVIAIALAMVSAIGGSVVAGYAILSMV